METYKLVMDKYIGRMVEILTATMLGLLCSMVFISVLSRYIFNFSLAWCEELAGLFFVWMTFLGSIAGIRKKSHMAIVFLVEKVAPEKQKRLYIYIHSTIIFFLAIMVWEGMRLTLATIADYSAVLRISIGLYYLSLPLCGMLMLLFSLRHISDLLQREVANEEFGGKEE